MSKSFDRAALKITCLAHLDDAAVEHPAGHQGTLAARYVMRTKSDDRIESMFEKGPKSPANLWMRECDASAALTMPLDYRRSPAAMANTTSDGDDPPKYGRHSALKPMRQLRDADLVCIRIRSVDELARILLAVLNK